MYNFNVIVLNNLVQILVLENISINVCHDQMKIRVSNTNN